MQVDRKTLWVIVLSVAFGWWLGSSPASPVNPDPRPSRPVLHAIARLTRELARLGLWVALAADPPPPPPVAQFRRVDADGHPAIDHAEGW